MDYVMPLAPIQAATRLNPLPPGVRRFKLEIPRYPGIKPTAAADAAGRLIFKCAAPVRGRSSVFLLGY
jgi:hypothetical protein